MRGIGLISALLIGVAGPALGESAPYRPDVPGNPFPDVGYVDADEDEAGSPLPIDDVGVEPDAEPDAGAVVQPDADPVVVLPDATEPVVQPDAAPPPRDAAVIEVVSPSSGCSATSLSSPWIVLVAGAALLARRRARATHLRAGPRA